MRSHPISAASTSDWVWGGNLTALILSFASLVVAATRGQAQSNYTPYSFTNFAGTPGGGGTNDGIGTAARFGGPEGVALDNLGNVYVADTFNYTVRKITPGAVVTTLAGAAGQYGTNDGTGNAARFGALYAEGPTGLAVDRAGNVYVADGYNCTIRKITPSGVVTTLAGSPGVPGPADGTGSAARFNYPRGLTVDNAGNIYVADENGCTIRKVTPGGVVTTLAGSPGSIGSMDGTGNAAEFSFPYGVAADSATNIYVADYFNCTIRKVTPAGVVTTLAGSAGKHGSADGIGSAARFGDNTSSGGPTAVAVGCDGNIYVTDQGNNTLRRVTPGGLVTTVAGLAGEFNYGNADGTGIQARFYYPIGVAADSAGNVYVSDTDNNRITKGAASIFRFSTGQRNLLVSNGMFSLQLIGPVGVGVVVDASGDLRFWTPIESNVFSQSGLALSVPIGTNRNQFFRARYAP